MSKSKSNQAGELNDGAKKPQSVSPSSKGAKLNTSDTLGSSASQQSQIGFQTTKPLDISNEDGSARLIMAIADKLGNLVFWKRVELVDGREVIALCFDTAKWKTNDKGELVLK